MTLDQQLDKLGDTAMRIAEDRATLLRLVKLALRIPPGPAYTSDRAHWQDEAERTLNSLAQARGSRAPQGKA